MSIEISDLLKYARTLANKEDCGEVVYRTAASRAYYSAYHGALFFSESFLPKGEAKRGEGKGVHQRLISRFLDHQKPGNEGTTHNSIADIGRLLKNLKSVRSKADYNLESNFPQSESMEAIARSERILRLLDEAIKAKGTM